MTVVVKMTREENDTKLGIFLTDLRGSLGREIHTNTESNCANALETMKRNELVQVSRSYL